MSEDYILNNIYQESLEIEKEWYYHAFDLPLLDDETFDMNNFNNMIKEGIKSKILRKKLITGYNGYYYVSLTKDEECMNSAFKALSKLPMFIINPNIKVIKAKNFNLQKSYPSWVNSGPLPFRYSPYDNEYQKFYKVKPEQIIGIRYNISEVLESNNGYKYKKLKLQLLKQIIESLINVSDLPIIDTNEGKTIDKFKYVKTLERIMK